MITDSFDVKSEAIINPFKKDNALVLDACILTFSYIVEEHVLKHYKCEKIASFRSVTGITPVYMIHHKGKKIGFFKTNAGAPAAAASIEETLSAMNTDNYIVFGGAGCLNKEIVHGKVMIPTEAYRDEGTSYHYAKASDYISIKNSDVVEQYMQNNGIAYVKGKTWTTDAFYRETKNSFNRHKNDGCISVEMECAALQAVCDFRNLELFVFFTSGDLLDAPAWDTRKKDGKLSGTQHDTNHFNLALELACFV